MTEKQRRLYEFVQQFEEFIIKDCEDDEIALQGNEEYLKDLHHVMNIIANTDDETITMCEPFDER